MIYPSNNRVRMVVIPERSVLGWFAEAANQWRGASHLHMPMTTGLPEDAAVLAVHYDFRRRVFSFTVHSATFSEILDGAEIPELEGQSPMVYQVVELRTDADRQREQWHIESHDREVEKFVHPDGFPSAEKLAGIKAAFRTVAENIRNDSRLIAGEDIPAGVHVLEIRGDKVFLAHHPEIVEGGLAEFKNFGDNWESCVVDKIDYANRRYEITFMGQEFTCDFKDVRPCQKGPVGAVGGIGCIGVTGPGLPHVSTFANAEIQSMWTMDDNAKKIVAERELQKSAPLPGDEADEMLAFFKGK